MLGAWSTALAGDFTTTNPDPVGPEWPHIDPGNTVLGNPGQKFAISRVPPAQLQVPAEIDAVTRGSALTTQLSSSRGLFGFRLFAVICVISWAPRGAQLLGAIQELTGTEAELVTASPSGLLTPVLTLDRGLLAPLAGGAPKCRTRPGPGCAWAIKA